ncbi:NIPSNAP family protein [Flavilitoribacter nigricans]|uniref:NIPSNAP family containing protein n=1 Tax=Flavilitoribacter nigricans (strain ATCC 23147 / DSM 23189 / NBRC 102662 / NCIMB 1420 / SS-2) TaxID=1122177 RepID=A0A2D0NG38_FLAN2|nr:NIPSNAP family protein [Flavilitoribacter nigricans]PHN07346.1 NIPSNAP family containing protein [Flavilitoribacter nigricans DSM 23189 = NBRC 102662]
MKRRNFIKTTAATAITASTIGTAAASNQSAPVATQQIYELRVYTLKRGGALNRLTSYLSSALIPALNRYGCPTVGVFKEMSAPEPTKIYLLIPYVSMEHFGGVGEFLSEDEDYQQAEKDYRMIPQDNTVYTRFDTWLMRAFSVMPEMKAPKAESRIFELRTYEGYSEDAVRRKVKMFNNGELPIFLETGLHPVFFGHLLSGPEMPALTYMLTFKDMEERDANWKAFIDHPDWKELSGLEEYANSVSNIIRRFLLPLDISQV